LISEFADIGRKDMSAARAEGFDSEDWVSSGVFLQTLQTLQFTILITFRLSE
jgi:hypothetical protein